MRNDKKTLTKTILAYINNLPYFSVDNLKLLDIPLYHLRIALSRLEKSGRIIRLKKGLYTATTYFDKMRSNRKLTMFTEFIAGKIYEPSYLSLDYVLYEHNVLTDIPTNYTSMTRKKTYTAANEIGVFMYHKIKDVLFCGFTPEHYNGFVYYKATRTKALFDYLYLRKHMIINEKAAHELRLNIDVFRKSELQDLQALVKLEGSAKMRRIIEFLV